MRHLLGEGASHCVRKGTTFFYRFVSSGKGGKKQLAFLGVRPWGGKGHLGSSGRHGCELVKGEGRRRASSRNGREKKKRLMAATQPLWPPIASFAVSTWTQEEERRRGNEFWREAFLGIRRRHEEGTSCLVLPRVSPRQIGGGERRRHRLRVEGAVTYPN